VEPVWQEIALADQLVLQDFCGFLDILDPRRFDENTCAVFEQRVRGLCHAFAIESWIEYVFELCPIDRHSVAPQRLNTSPITLSVYRVPWLSDYAPLPLTPRPIPNNSLSQTEDFCST
jgi:hypothetical protein